MLVLSRKTSEEVVFPALGVSISVMRVSRNKVQLGIVAPKSLKVVRGELVGYFELIETLKSIGKQIGSHEIRGRLNSAVLNLEVLTAAGKKGLEIDEVSIVENVMDQLSNLEKTICQHVNPLAPTAATLASTTRLLVVDDSLNERELLKSILVIQGFQVVTASDGADAIRQLNLGELPHAVLLDMQMPTLSGEKTLRCIRSDYRLRNLRVIGISGHQPDHGVIPDGMQGFDAWMDKPVDLSRLVGLIHEPDESECFDKRSSAK